MDVLGTPHHRLFSLWHCLPRPATAAREGVRRRRCIDLWSGRRRRAAASDPPQPRRDRDRSPHPLYVLESNRRNRTALPRPAEQGPKHTQQPRNSDTNPATHLRLRLAIMEACQRLVSPSEREAIAQVMSRQEYLDLSSRFILPSLTGHYRYTKGGQKVSIPNFHVFWKYQAGFPWRSHAQWILSQSSQSLGKTISTEQAQALVQQCWRPDLYREAARLLGTPYPMQDSKPENCHEQEWSLNSEIVLGADQRLHP